MTLTPHIVARVRLSPVVRDAMFALHSRNFANVCRERFLMDLDEKDWVILLVKPDGGIAGFSTQKLIPPAPGSGLARFVFSGDTIVDREHWNTPLLAGCFGHLLLRMIDLYGEKDLYWFLISKGFRTYRALPIFFNRFWPAPGRETPQQVKELLSAVARRRYGDAFDPVSGLIRMPDADRLVPELADVPDARLRDPSVSFFLERNPGFVNGDELACLAPVCRDNFNAYADRVIRSLKPEWQC